MQVILLEKVANLGQLGDVVKVIVVKVDVPRRELDLAVREVQRRGGPRVEMTPKQKPQKAKHHHGKKPKQGKRQGHRKGRGRR